MSFGHFHGTAALAAPAIQSQTDLAYAQGLAVEAASQAQQPGGNHDNDPPSNEPCAICAVMSMANQMLFATPVLLLLPDVVELLYLVTDAELAHLSESWPGFQSRAPPVS
ncbi:MAG TPA: DUF2946 family protein, partial [Rhizomicrobium sp.]